ncbi:hypothetical protein QRX25_10380 [Bacillus sp. L381]|uniref:hypothetical protein n=1 Tax=Bacillus TaxID=1386 RepID=UPI001CA3AF57|nr:MULTISPECIES: hypothetical protein [Bacillus]QZY10173.1 hypothetical protein K7B13_10310 [Bacillus amyloliquefaciens]QZY11083.1 hypothetical protein K7B13_15310 [Bacillus amyloliquefaciens]WIX20071.1 hypothetical protein QRX25_10380 [Bacillus sp. L381]
MEELEQDLKKLYLENAERPADIYYLDEMDISWFFELSHFADGNSPQVSNRGARKTKKQPKLGFIDQIPGF